MGEQLALRLSLTGILEEFMCCGDLLMSSARVAPGPPHVCASYLGIKRLQQATYKPPMAIDGCATLSLRTRYWD